MIIMNKSELLNEHIEKINLAVEKGLGEKNWAIISLLSGGLTGVPVYKIEVKTKFYAIKLENVNDERFDLIRSYQIIETVSKQGISPFVYFANPDHGIILMDYIESKPRPEATPESIQNIAELIRKLHHNNAFSKWKSVIEILYETYSAVPDQYRKSNLIDKSMSEIKKIQQILFDEADVRACHCDLNPVNLLYDGNNYFLVDWQAASPQSFYFDLAYSATWFYFYSENISTSYLNAYLEREANKEEKAKYYLMRVFANIYLGIGFISLSGAFRNEVQFPFFRMIC